MRNVRECARLAARDLKVKTALLDARYLCGDRSPYDEFEDGVVDEVWVAEPAAFFRDKLKESEERHAKLGDSIYLLQPQLKDGMGGLRDLHTALWMVKVRSRFAASASWSPSGCWSSATSSSSTGRSTSCGACATRCTSSRGGTRTCSATSSRMCWRRSSASGPAGPPSPTSCITSMPRPPRCIA